MEELWKDISLTSLQVPSTRKEALKSSTSCFRGVILEDFLTRTFKETPPNTVIDHPDIAIGLFVSTPTIPPPTVPSFSSSSEFQYLDAMASHQGHCNAIDGVSPNTLLDSFRSLSGRKKKTQSGNRSKNRRHRRMIKNRESAARSRARKQAWVLIDSFSTLLFCFCCGNFIRRNGCCGNFIQRNGFLERGRRRNRRRGRRHSRCINERRPRQR